MAAVLRDPQNITRKMLDEMTRLIDAAVAREEAQAVEQVAIARSMPERDPSRPADQQGLFNKFEVYRTDRTDVIGGKHHKCDYFVLDLTHDKHAPAALLAYAESCKATHPHLSADLLARFPAPAPSGERETLRQRLGEALTEALADETAAESPDWFDAREIDRVIDAILPAIRADMLAADAAELADAERSIDDLKEIIGRLAGARQVAVPQEPISVYRLMRKVDGVWVSASEFTTGHPDASWEDVANKNPMEWRIQRLVTGKQIAEGFAKALRQQAAVPQDEPKHPFQLWVEYASKIESLEREVVFLKSRLAKAAPQPPRADARTPLDQPQLQAMWNDAMYANRWSTTDAAMAYGQAIQAHHGIGAKP